MKRSVAATLITTEAILFFLVPLALAVWLLVSKLQDINLDPQSIIAPIESAANIIKEKTGYDVLGKDTTSFIISALPAIGQFVMGSISSFAVNLFVLVFVLYFMLIGGQRMEKYISEILPFSEANTEHVVHDIKMIVHSNAVGIPLLAIIQGGVAMIGYWFFDVPDILLTGFLTCLATVIPMVGTALVWFPIAVYMALSGDLFNGIGLAIFGTLIISQLDNLIRFILQKKMADIHPLITIFGVVIGLSLFGFMGVIFGPLLLSLFFLFVDMFDTIGTLVGTASRAGMLDKNGKMPNMKQALLSDAVGTVAGSLTGTSTVTTFVESASGVEAGGRTGLTALTTGIMFLACIFIAPIAGIIPAAATSSALIYVGVLMVAGLKNVDFDDICQSLPVALMMIAMPISGSIGHAIGLGLITYTVIKVFTGKAKDVSVLTYVLSLIFLLKFFIVA